MEAVASPRSGDGWIVAAGFSAGLRGRRGSPRIGYPAMVKRPSPEGIAAHESATLAPGGMWEIRRNPIAWVFALLTVAYAVFLACATHHPHPDALMPGIARLQDALLHFGAYAVLGCLASATLVAFRGRAGWAAILALLLALAGLAALDEVTQPLFGRMAEIKDWVSDLAGIAVGGLAAGLAARILAIFRLRPAKTF